MTTDLTNCDTEPIHRPGAIQPHGVLIVCRASDFTITHVSENVAEKFGIPVGALLGSSVSHVFPAAEAQSREKMLRDEVVDSKPVYVFTIRVRGVSQPFDAIAHRSGELIFIEFEPVQEFRELSAPELYRLTQKSIARIQHRQTVDELCAACAEQVRKINGFDRVMVYRFDQEWNGQVIAEDVCSDLEPFFGLHYPASDIPVQARELYTKNWLRFIADRQYVPCPILATGRDDDPQQLDMSFSVLRSVSPIHVEYLGNMGVEASMSISLIRNGQLWGLIACHHYSPRFVPYDVRTASELLGQMMSLSLAEADDRELKGYSESMRSVSDQLLANVERFDDTAKALIEARPNLLAFLQSEGAAVVKGNEITRVGQTPGEDEIRRLSAWLHERPPRDVFATDNLQEVFGTGVLHSVASGMLAVTLGSAHAHQLLWFRTEQVRTVDWAGDPSKSVTKGGGEARLSPRGSFSLWKEMVRGRSKPWKAAERLAAQNLRDGIARQMLRRTEELAASNTDLRLASDEREKALESERAARAESERLNRLKDDFVATLSHELRTPLNAILGWSQVLVRVPGVDQQILEGLAVIERNARSQAQMIEDLLDVSRIISGKLRLDLQDTQLPNIVDTAVDTVSLTAEAKGVRIEKLIDPLIGIHTTGDPNRLQQVVWNLVSNAVKFTPRDGKIQVVLERVGSHVELTVSDSGQGIAPEFLPYVFERFRQADASASRQHGGLGLGLSIVRNLVELHGGNVRAYSLGAGKGSSFVVSLPVRSVLLPERAQRSTTTNQSPQFDTQVIQLSGVRVLTLDDEPDARKLVHRILTECNANVLDLATIDDALNALCEEQFDVVISDIGMPGGDGYEFIRRWRELEGKLGRTKTPAIALTAYARVEDRRRVILAGFQAHIAKPVESGELLALVASLANRV